jgi:pyridoxine 5-phosphate synthase
MTRLSVNINKIALIRNARQGNIPDVIKAAVDIENFGAEGITVHPRPDERHIRYSDVRQIAPLIKTEFNIEGNPVIDKFVDLVLEVKPHQVTLVPDHPGQITSDHGWNVKKEMSFLKKMIELFKNTGIRTSIFVDPDPDIIKAAADTGTDRVELYTEPYAKTYLINKEKAIEPYKIAAATAKDCGLGINAGHDLNLHNLNFLIRNIPFIDEVSIGHALIADALYYGLENTVQMYLRQIKDL